MRASRSGRANGASSASAWGGGGIVLALLACTPAPPAPVARPLPAAPPDAGPPDKVASAPQGEVAVALVGEDGRYWPGLATPDPPVAIVRPCVSGPDAGSPVAGWIVFSLALSWEGSSRVKLVESSPLPDGFVACIAHALSGLRPAPGFNPSPLLAYVSVR